MSTSAGVFKEIEFKRKVSNLCRAFVTPHLTKFASTIPGLTYSFNIIT